MTGVVVRPMLQWVHGPGLMEMVKVKARAVCAAGVSQAAADPGGKPRLRAVLIERRDAAEMPGGGCC